MAAGDYGNLTASWTYGSAPPLGAGDAKYKWGLQDEILQLPDSELEVIPRKSGNSALPNGRYFKKRKVWNAMIRIGCYVIDAVPFYHHMGKVTESGTPGSVFPDFLIEYDPEGIPVPITIHIENNELNDNQATEYYPCYCVKQEVSFKNGRLYVINSYVPLREYTMTDDSVVRKTTSLSRRGNKSPTRGFNIGNPNNVTIWELDGGNKTLTTLFNGFSYTSEVVGEPIVEEDGNDYAVDWGPRGEYKISDIKAMFTQDKANTVLDELKGLIDKSTGTETNDQLAFTLGRRHANDYLEFNFVECVLAGYLQSLNQSEIKSETPVLEAIFRAVQAIKIEERTTLAAGTSDYNNSATYGL